jgi:hypothetical protein
MIKFKKPTLSDRKDTGIMRRSIIVFLSLLSFVTCGATLHAEDSLPEEMSPREKTWMGEDAEQSRNTFLSKRESTSGKIAIDSSFQKTLLKESNTPKGVVKDEASCKKTFRPLEEKRKALQYDGGMWHAFERSPEVRPFSNTGMQIDSNFNKVAQAVQHLCATANGVPKSPIARMVADIIKERGGKDGARQYFSDMGRAKKDIEIWFNYEAAAEKATTRTVSYEAIEGLMRRFQTLLTGYEDLYNRKVTAAEKDKFLSQSKTLLTVINDSLVKVPEFAMAQAEEMAEPHVKFIGEH